MTGRASSRSEFMVIKRETLIPIFEGMDVNSSIRMSELEDFTAWTRCCPRWVLTRSPSRRFSRDHRTALQFVWCHWMMFPGNNREYVADLAIINKLIDWKYSTCQGCQWCRNLWLTCFDLIAFVVVVCHGELSFMNLVKIWFFILSTDSWLNSVI